MKKLAILIVAILLIPSFTGCLEKEKKNVDTESKIEWRSYKDGMSEANETGKPVILYFYSGNESVIFLNERIVKRAKNFIMVKINIEKDNETIINKYNVTKTPLLIFMENGNVVTKLDVIDEADIIYQMDSIIAKINEKIAWLDYSSGMEMANKTGKPVLLYICSNSSSICKNTNDIIFSNKSIIEKSREFVMIKINTDNIENKDIVYSYRLQYIPYIPTIIFIHNGIILHRLIAFDVINPNDKKQSINNFIENMDKALEGKIWGHDFAFVTLNGKTKHLKDYRGKIVLVDLMATWCQPCRMQMTELKKVLNHYGKNKIAIISIDVEQKDSPEKIKSTFGDHVNEWTFGMDKYGVANMYLLEGSIPTLIIFDKYGRLEYLRPGLTQAQNLISIIDGIE